MKIESQLRPSTHLCHKILLHNIPKIVQSNITHKIYQTHTNANSFNSKIIQYCQFYFGYLPFSYNIALRTINFLLNLKNGPAYNTKFMLTWTSNSDPNDLLTKYNLNSGSSLTGIHWQINQ